MMVLDKLVRTNPAPQAGFGTQQGHTQGPSAGGSPSGGAASLQQSQANTRALIAQLVQGNMSIEMMRSKGLPDVLIQQVDIFRRQRQANQGVPSNMLQGPRPPGGGPAPLSHPQGSENFPGNNNQMAGMAGMPNGPVPRQMLPVPPNQMIQGQAPLTAQGQLHNQALAKTSPERLQAAGLLVKKMREQANEDRSTLNSAYLSVSSSSDL